MFSNWIKIKRKNNLINNHNSNLIYNCLGGGLMLFVREDIPSNLLTIEEKPMFCQCSIFLSQILNNFIN